jgi:hypothetical protein
VRRDTAAPVLGDLGGHPKSTKKRHGKRVLQKASPKRPLGIHGSLREPLGGQMEPKWEPKGSKKSSKNDVFSSSEATLRNVTKTQYLLHFSHFHGSEKRRFLVILALQNQGRNREATKRSKMAPTMLTEGLQSGPRAEHWSQQGAKRDPKGLPK